MPQFSHRDSRSTSVAAPMEPSWNALGSSMVGPDLPDIIVTTKDAARLSALVGDFLQIRDKQVAFLARELDRAAVVDPAGIGGGVVTMRSLVDFRDGEEACRAMLVYPGEASVSENMIPVLTPVGTALLGLSEGQCMPYEATGGTARRLTVLRVLFQPEDNGMIWL